MAEWAGRSARSDLRGRFLLEAGFVVAWSSGFVGATLGARYAGAATLLAWRYFLCAGVILAVVFALGRVWPGRREIVRQVIVGLFAQVMYLGFIWWSADVGVSGGIAALIGALQPLVAVALAGLMLDEKTGTMKWIGLTAGLVGVTLVVGGEIGSRTDVPMWGYALPFAAMLGLVAATLFELRTKRSAKNETTLDVALAIQFTVGAIVFGAFALAQGVIVPPGSTGFWVAIVWVVVLSTIGGYGFYWVNVRVSGVGRVSTLLYLTPPITMIWSYLMFGQGIGLVAVVGMAVCAVGVILARD